MPSDSPESAELNPEARRTYRILGWIHAPLFGALLGLPTYREVGLLAGLIAGLVGAAMTLGLFYRLADDHYRGNVPGEPGALIYKGDNDE